MINLITGTPGSGKTSYALQFMLEQLKGSKRKIYVHGITDLKVPHEKLYCKSKNCDVCSQYDVEGMHDSFLCEHWHEYASIGSVIFFDEAQNIFRPRSSSKLPPDCVQSFEVHRHKGLDFFIITQSPKLIDLNIRQLVSRHIHLKPTWAGRFQYEWAECKDSVQSTSDSIRSKYKLEKKTFALYKSALVHTKQSRKIPMQVYMLMFCVVSVTLLGMRVASRISPDNTKNNVEVIAGTVEGVSATETVPVITELSIKNIENNVDFKELALLSEYIVPPKILESYKCKTISLYSKSCQISKNVVSSFKNSYCVGAYCYAIVPVKHREIQNQENNIYNQS